MLYRETTDGLLVVTQPAHAWVSGQLAREWGNEVFGAIEPREEVCLGAEQHDLGWLEWEQRPTIHPRTGRPHRFFDLPTGEHLALWRGASQRALALGRYPALLVSLHISRLYERHDDRADTPEETRAVHDFLAEERSFQERLLASLRVDSRYAPHATPEIIERNRRLVAAWDSLSLALCSGRAEALVIPNVPATGSGTPLTLAPSATRSGGFTLAPWPFRAAVVTIVVDARRIPPGPYVHDAALRATLEAAEWTALEIALEPG